MRYKQAIQIGDNVTDIMRLPCAICAEKHIVGNKSFINYKLFGDTITSMFAWGETIIAYSGDWLCEDYDGRWHLLNDKEYKDGLEDREQCAGA